MFDFFFFLCVCFSYDLLNAKMRARMEVKESPEKGVFVKGKKKQSEKKQ
jgi:hypothetical protein